MFPFAKYTVLFFFFFKKKTHYLTFRLNSSLLLEVRANSLLTFEMLQTLLECICLSYDFKESLFKSWEHSSWDWKHHALPPKGKEGQVLLIDNPEIFSHSQRILKPER